MRIQAEQMQAVAIIVAKSRLAKGCVQAIIIITEEALLVARLQALRKVHPNQLPFRTTKTVQILTVMMKSLHTGMQKAIPQHTIQKT